jgi:IS5 family transposase
MILDCVIEEGNPADATLAVKMIDRQIAIYDTPPRQASLDGGFASKQNLWDIRGKGVKDIVFSKKRGLPLSEMAKSTWVYTQLKKFRADIEGSISFLKRCFGLERCTWKGLESFKSYVWSSVVSMNLLILARHRME